MDLVKSLNVEILANSSENSAEVLTQKALDFIAKLHVKFNKRRVNHPYIR